MADVAHLVRASGCGSEGRGFDPLHSPQVIIKNSVITTEFFITVRQRYRLLASFYQEYFQRDRDLSQVSFLGRHYPQEAT